MRQQRSVWLRHIWWGGIHGFGCAWFAAGMWSLIQIAGVVPADVYRGNANGFVGMILGVILGTVVGTAQRWVRGEQVRAISYWLRQNIGVWAIIGAALETLGWRVFAIGGSAETVIAIGGAQGVIVGIVQSIGLGLRRADTQGWVLLGTILGALGAHAGNNYIGGVLGCMGGLLLGEAVAIIPVLIIWTPLSRRLVRSNRIE